MAANLSSLCSVLKTSTLFRSASSLKWCTCPITLNGNTSTTSWSKKNRVSFSHLTNFFITCRWSSKYTYFPFLIYGFLVELIIQLSNLYERKNHEPGRGLDPGLNLHRFWWYINNQECVLCGHAIFNTSNFVQETSACYTSFSTLFLWVFCWNALSCVWKLLTVAVKLLKKKIELHISTSHS